MFGAFASMSASAPTLWERIGEWYQNSFLRDIVAFFDTLFRVELGTYENFSVGFGVGNVVRDIIIALAVGMIAAAIMTAYTRIGLGGFVRALLEQKCDSPATAKTLMELGYFRSSMIRRALLRDSALKLVVRRAEASSTVEDSEANGENDENQTVEEETDQAQNTEKEAKKATRIAKFARKAPSIDFLTARFYIPEDLRYRAEIRFDKKGSGLGAVAVVAVLTAVVAILLCRFLPSLFTLADNIITMLAP